MEEKRLECLMMLQIHRSDTSSSLIDRFATTVEVNRTVKVSIFDVYTLPKNHYTDQFAEHVRCQVTEYIADAKKRSWFRLPSSYRVKLSSGLRIHKRTY